LVLGFQGCRAQSSSWKISSTTTNSGRLWECVWLINSGTRPESTVWHVSRG